MSSEEAVTDALQTPLENNAGAADDVKKMLAELKGGAESKDSGDATGATTNTNGSSAAKVENGAGEDKENKVDDDTHPDRRRRNDDDDDGEPRYRRDRDRDDGRRGGGYRAGRGGRGRGRGDFNRVNKRDNIKSNLVQEEESDDPVAIRKQVEFYFSDSNLPMDKFLLSSVGGSKNNPVPLTTLHNFKRMRHFQPFEAIVEAMRTSDFLDLIEEEGEPPSVRRKEPLPEALNDGPDPEAVRIFEDKAMPASIYAKGFGEEGRGTQLDIEKFFEPYGPVKAVRLRRSNDMMFKGSVFVEFASVELQEKFLALDPTPQFEGKQLSIMSKKHYCDQKVEDIKAGRLKPNVPHDRPNRGGGRRNYDDRDGRPRRNHDDDDDRRDWRTRRDEDRKNGFRDDKRGGGGHDRDDRRGRGPGYGAGRARREKKEEVDERGVPIVHVSPESALTAEAYAKARKAVEEEEEEAAQKKEKKDDDAAAKDVENTEQDGTEPAANTVNEAGESIKADVSATTGGGKREREEEDGDAEVSEAKKSKVDDTHT